jgi:Icc-related predicted phosphoesterase
MLTKTAPRLWSLDAGRAMVVTDLHGDWETYQRLRDIFVELHTRRQADYLVFTGDLIHSDLPAEADRSLAIVLDVIRLRAAYGEAIIYICGNHELPHIYSFGLSKGQREVTAPFEAALTHSGRRAAVVDLFLDLPFYIRTAAGVSLTHAGAAEAAASGEAAGEIFAWDHRIKLAEAATALAGMNVEGLRTRYAHLSQAEAYEELARHYLAVSGPDDPRYDDLLRGFIITTHPKFNTVWSALFSRGEQEYGLAAYAKILTRFLQHLSADYAPQRVLVAGHLAARQGYQIIAEKHLRLASSSHAIPRSAGRYLLFDAARPVEMADLLAGLRSVYR